MFCIVLTLFYKDIIICLKFLKLFKVSDLLCFPILQII